MEAAGDRVAAASELPAGVEDRHDDFDCGPVLGGVLVDGDAAAVVDHFDPAVGLDGDLDVVGVPGQSLVDGVVDDLVHQVVQAPLPGGSDVHARALADGFESFENGDVRGAVGRGAVGLVVDVSHVAPLAHGPDH